MEAKIKVNPGFEEGKHYNRRTHFRFKLKISKICRLKYIN